MTRPAAIQLEISQIGELKPEDYVGLIDRNAVECLKVRLQVEGLLTPIWVRRNGNAGKAPYSVIAGRHRLIAARELGMAVIDAEVRTGPDSKPDELRRLQLAENLDRRELRPIERACFIMDRWRAHADVQGWDIVSHARELDDITGKACGDVDGRTIRRYRALYDKLVAPFPDQFALINAHPLGKSYSAMQTLAAEKLIEPTADRPVGVPHRRKAVAKLLERDDWPNMLAVMVAAGLNKSTGDRPKGQAAHERKLMTAWAKLPSSAKRSHFVEMARDIPHSLVRQTIEELKAMLP